MAEQKKITEGLCRSCKYSQSAVTQKQPIGICGYILATNISRVFKDGGYRDDYRPGFCQVYEERKEKKKCTAYTIKH